MNNGRIIQLAVFLIISCVLAPIIIDHQIILDVKFNFERTTFVGWLITSATTFISLLLIKWAFDLNNGCKCKIKNKQG